MAPTSAKPGERWLVNFQPVDAAPQAFKEVAVTLADFDPRTDTWTVRPEWASQSFALLAKHLIKPLI